MRINKYLAECGVASRRASEELIKKGVVKVNGKTVSDLATDISPTDSVTVEGKPVRIKNKKYYIMLHKPRGYVTTVKDEAGRKTVMELIDIKARLYPIGRLDYDTEGLLLFTNDGDLANRLMHPSHGVSKTYVARVSGRVSAAEVETLKSGMEIDGAKTQPAKVTVLAGDEHKTRLEITIYEGKNHQIRKMLEQIGKPVEFLKRVAVGEIHLGGLTRGTYRDLNKKELDYLLGLK